MIPPNNSTKRVIVSFVDYGVYWFVSTLSESFRYA